MALQTCRVRFRSLHQIEICIAQNEPFCAGSLKIHFNSRMCTLSFAVKYDAVPELSVPNALTKPYAELATGRGRR